ncbi:MAG: hypothetical protein WCW27_00810 [Patescibacteria group bacterium]|jgi:hypothetical protein
MQKICQVTKQPFTVTSEELDFQKKISPTFSGQKFLIPPPTLSPLERLRRRTSQRNENFFYHNKSAFSGQPLISIYASNSNCKVVTHDEWFSDAWDALSYGQAVNTTQPFFVQFASLQAKVPRANVVALSNENSDYSTGTAYCKNCYLINSSEYCEDCYYGKLFQSSKNCLDCTYVYNSELLYECFNVDKGYNCKYVYNSQDVTDSWFCDNLRGCQDCFLCTNLFGQQYYFLNQSLSESEYKQKVKEYIGDPKKLAEAKITFADLRKKRIYKYANIVKSEACTGDFIANSKQCVDCYDMTDSEDCRYVQVGVQVKDLLDCSNMYIKPELSYEVLGTIGTYNVHFCLFVFHSSDLWYCEQCFSCQHCFGCVGLRNKQYCIFNKQYAKDEYEKQAAQIIEQMQKTHSTSSGPNGWGEFFPSSLSPFGYNETLANEYLPLTKTEALARGYNWREENVFAAKQDEYVIPPNINDVPDDICQKILYCSATGKPYKIIPQELKFYRQMGLPIPRLCPEQRYRERMQLRHPRQLWNRTCAKCKQAVKTTFTPERPEAVYCEECYNKAIY